MCVYISGSTSDRIKVASRPGYIVRFRWLFVDGLLRSQREHLLNNLDQFLLNLSEENMKYKNREPTSLAISLCILRDGDDDTVAAITRASSTRIAFLSQIESITLQSPDIFH
jgi:hypothetical protein